MVATCALSKFQPSHMAQLRGQKASNLRASNSVIPDFKIL